MYDPNGRYRYTNGCVSQTLTHLSNHNRLSLYEELARRPGHTRYYRPDDAWLDSRHQSGCEYWQCDPLVRHCLDVWGEVTTKTLTVK